MALVSPTLDNRTYADLRDELVKRIPVYAPEWTNHNESDPGIALIELFAHLGESLLYRFNQIPETTQLAFLRLLGVQPRPPQCAQSVLVAVTDLPEGVQILRGSEARAGAVPFETDDEVYAWPLDIVAAAKIRSVDTGTRADRERRADARQRAGVSETDARFYTTSTVPEDPLQPDAVAIDVSGTIDHALWIGLRAKPTTDVERLAGRTVFVGVAFVEALLPDQPLASASRADDRGGIVVPSGHGHMQSLQADSLTAGPPPMQCQLWNGDPKATGRDAFTDLAVAGDTSRGLTTTGVVKIEMPARLPTVRATTGAADCPPPLTDAKVAAQVIAWIRVTRPATTSVGDAIGAVRWVGVNAVSVTQCRTAAPELLGTGSGEGDQRYPLSQRPALKGSATVQVEEAEGWVEWREVDNFLGVGPDDRCYALDRQDGVISFGRMRVPQIGERIRATSYRYGGGVRGNVAAGSITSIAGIGGVRVTNPLPAAGGGDGASLPDAIDAIPAEVHRRDRAVTPDDFRDLAQQVSGVRRAEALALLHPDRPHDVSAGVVTVLVLPTDDLRNPAAPVPDLGLLRRTARYLDARRLVTTELYVVPPVYVQLLVSAGVQVRPGYQVDAVRRWVEQILRQYLSPVPPFGPDGRGWPLGRAVRRAELEAVAVQVEGVEYLEDLLLGTMPPASSGALAPVAQTLVTLERWQLPELASLAVVSGTPLPLGDAYQPTPPDGVPVPLPPDVC